MNLFWKATAFQFYRLLPLEVEAILHPKWMLRYELGTWSIRRSFWFRSLEHHFIGCTAIGWPVGRRENDFYPRLLAKIFGQKIAECLEI